MTYLLDTHYVLWSIADSRKLSAKAKHVISNPDNTIVVSAISFWEVAWKSALGKLQISGFTPEELPDICLKLGFNILPLLPEDSSTYYKLTATYHKDPFDRMLIWQAIQHHYTLISADSNIKGYASEGLNIWNGK